MMDSLRTFHDNVLVLRPEPGSFTAEGDSARWSNKDLDPVKPEKKKWEWYHVGGFWIAEGFSAAQMESASSAVALGLNPGIAIAACLVGNLMVTVPLCVMGYVGSKASRDRSSGKKAIINMRTSIRSTSPSSQERKSRNSIQLHVYGVMD
jgi:NCS1 family nucleobase:cation symporter-1